MPDYCPFCTFVSWGGQGESHLRDVHGIVGELPPELISRPELIEQEKAKIIEQEKQERIMWTLKRYKEITEVTVAQFSLEDMLAYHEFGKIMANAYTEFGIEVPGELTNTQSVLRNQIKTVLVGEVKRKLQLARSRFESLKTLDEKRTDAQVEVQRLESELAKATGS